LVDIEDKVVGEVEVVEDLERVSSKISTVGGAGDC